MRAVADWGARGHDGAAARLRVDLDALTFNEARPDVDELIDAWVEGYREVETLAEDDEAEIPTFLMLRRLLLSAYIGLRPDTELAHELRQNGFASESCALAERYLAKFT